MSATGNPWDSRAGRPDPINHALAEHPISAADWRHITQALEQERQKVIRLEQRVWELDAYVQYLEADRRPSSRTAELEGALREIRIIAELWS